MVVGTKLFLGDSELYANPTYYRSIVGALQYLTMTGPILSSIVNGLSQFLIEPTDLQW